MNEERLKRIDEFSLADLEAVRLLLRGDSVIDWHRLNFENESEARDFIIAQEFRPDETADRARIDAIKGEAISFLRRHFEFPIPKPIERASAAGDPTLDRNGYLPFASIRVELIGKTFHHARQERLD